MNKFTRLSFFICTSYKFYRYDDELGWPLLKLCELFGLSLFLSFQTYISCNVHMFIFINMFCCSLYVIIECIIYIVVLCNFVFIDGMRNKWNEMKKNCTNLCNCMNIECSYTDYGLSFKCRPNVLYFLILFLLFYI